MRSEEWMVRICGIGIAVVLLGAMTFGQVCPEQTYKPASTCPYTVDPNQIGVDPVSGEPDLIGWYAVDVSQTVTIDGWVCDDDGDAMVVTASVGELTMVTPASYVLRYTPTAVGLTYIHLAVTDQPPDHQQPITRTGTIVVAATQPDSPPAIGCGSRP